jgi:hypothetical protein
MLVLQREQWEQWERQQQEQQEQGHTMLINEAMIRAITIPIRPRLANIIIPMNPTILKTDNLLIFLQSPMIGMILPWLQDTVHHQLNISKGGPVN